METVPALRKEDADSIVLLCGLPCDASDEDVRASVVQVVGDEASVSLLLVSRLPSSGVCLGSAVVKVDSPDVVTQLCQAELKVRTAPHTTQHVLGAQSGMHRL